jgi:hypothetical protein
MRMSEKKQVASQVSFPDAVFIKDGKPIEDWVRITRVLYTEDFEALGGGRYKDIYGNIGMFHCYRCVQQGCSQEHSIFRNLGESNFFSHIHNSHGCDCETAYSRSYNANNRHIVWRFALLDGRNATTILGCPNHRLVCYLPMPDYIEEEHRSAFKEKLLGEFNRVTQEQVGVPIQSHEDCISLPKRHKFLSSWMDEDDCPYAFIVFLSNLDLPDSFSFHFHGLEFKISNELRKSWERGALLFQRTKNSGIFSKDGESRSHALIKPKQAEIMGETTLSYIVDDLHPRAPVLVLSEEINTGGGQPFESNLMGSIRPFVNISGLRVSIKKWTKKLHDKDAIVRTAQHSTRRLFEVEQNENNITHIFRQPPNSSEWTLRLEPHGGDAVESVGDDLDFQAAAYDSLYQNVHPLSFPPNTTDRSMIHLLEIRGFGMLNLRSKTHKESHTVDLGGGKNQVKRVGPSTTPDSFEHVLFLLKAIGGDHFEDYAPPKPLLKLPIGDCIRADLHRYILNAQFDGGSKRVTTHRLSRFQNLVNQILDVEDDDAAYYLLEGLEEIQYGEWEGNGQEEEEEGEITRNTIIPVEDSFFTLDDNGLGFVISLQPAKQLARFLGLTVCLGSDSVLSNHLILLESGARLAPVEVLRSSKGFVELDCFPGLQRLPKHPYHLLRACFNDDEAKKEINNYKRISGNVMQRMQDPDYGEEHLYAFNPGKITTSYGRIKKTIMGRLSRNSEWQDLSEASSEGMEIIGSNGDRISMILNHIDLPNPDPMTGREHSVSLYLVLEDTEGSRRLSKLYEMSSSDSIPLPWDKLFSGMADGRTRKFIRFEAVNLVLLAFISCAALGGFNIDSKYQFSLLPIPFQRWLIDSYQSNELEAIGTDHLAQFRSLIRKSFWMGEN